MTELLTRDEIIDALLAAIDAHPDQLNPTNHEGLCLYTAMDNPDLHCVVGQVAADLGWKVPDSTVNVGARLASERFAWPVDGVGRDLLGYAQGWADIATKDGRPWSTIRADIEAMR